MYMNTLTGGVKMEKNQMSFGAFVRTKRESLGKSLRSVAAEIDMAPAYLSDIEKVTGGHLSSTSKNLLKSLELKA